MTEVESKELAKRLDGMSFNEAKELGIEITKLLAEKGLSFRQAEGVLDYAKDLLKDVRMQKFQR